jgi:copper(I)-binding protein
MKMLPVTALAVEPGKPVALKPGSLHIMLLGLKQPLRRGDRFPLTLTFEKAPPVTVDVAIQGPGAAGPAMDHGSMGSGTMNHGSMAPGSMNHEAPKP